MAESGAIDRYVVDTHSPFWYLTASPRLGQQARQAIDQGTRGEAILYVPVIVLAELYFLNEKLGHPLDFRQEHARLEQDGPFTFVAFHPRDVLDFNAHSAVTEMHDRIIVGVAQRLKSVCLSRNRNITDSNLVQVLW